jgi:CheY-like chemotaxis protein
MLHKISKEILHAITGVQAVEACRNNPDIDLVLMDIRMPDMDGNDATRQIRQFNTDVIIIAQTAYAFSGDKEKAIEAGCNDYISKPINYTLLFELIKKHVNN